MNFDNLHKLPTPTSVDPRRRSPMGRLLGLAVLLVATAILATTIALSGLAGSDTSGSGKPTDRVQGQLLAAANANTNPELPGDATETATAIVTPAVTPTSTDVATEDPDATETEIPIDTPQPSRTGVATVTRIPTAVLTMVVLQQLEQSAKVENEPPQTLQVSPL